MLFRFQTATALGQAKRERAPATVVKTAMVLGANARIPARPFARTTAAILASFSATHLRLASKLTVFGVLCRDEKNSPCTATEH